MHNYNVLLKRLHETYLLGSPSQMEYVKVSFKMKRFDREICRDLEVTWNTCDRLGSHFWRV